MMCVRECVCVCVVGGLQVIFSDERTPVRSVKCVACDVNQEGVPIT